jgi:hypothetical protein
LKGVNRERESSGKLNQPAAAETNKLGGGSKRGSDVHTSNPDQTTEKSMVAQDCAGRDRGHCADTEGVNNGSRIQRGSAVGGRLFYLPRAHA